jgi:outer membrane lipoprotein SlyB
MRKLLIAAILAAATAACATPYAPQEFDFSELAGLDGMVYGIVETVRAVELDQRPAGLAGVFEHAIRPEAGDELVVRLDDGRAITVVQDGMQRFEPGQRVRVVPGRRGARVEHT